MLIKNFYKNNSFARKWEKLKFTSDSEMRAEKLFLYTISNSVEALVGEWVRKSVIYSMEEN